MRTLYRTVFLLAAMVALMISGTAGSDLPFSGERLTFEVTFLNIPVVRAEWEVAEVGFSGDEAVVHLAVVGRSTPFYSLLYPVNNRYDAYFTWPSAHTLKYTRCIDEPGVDLQRTIRYQNGLALTEGVDPRPVPGGVRDLFTALYALRGQPLQDGQIIESLLDLDGQMWTALTTVLGREMTKTHLGSHRAVKVLVRFHPLSQDGHERPESDVMTNNLVREKTKLTFWFSDDDRHLPLRAEYRMAPFSLKTVLSSIN
jgi:hypothetical protein